MFEERSRQLYRVMILLDSCLTVVAYILALWQRQIIMPYSNVDYYSHMSLLPLILFLVIFSCSYMGSYNSVRTTTGLAYSWSVIRGFVFSISILLTLLFILRIQYVSRLAIVLFAGNAIFLLIAMRAASILYFKKSIQKGENFLKVLIIGTGARARRLTKTLRRNQEWGIDIIGYLDTDASMVGSPILDLLVISTVADISAVLKQHVIDEVLLAIPRTMIDDVDAIAYACEEEGVRFRFMADMFDLEIARMSLVELDDIPLLTLEPVAQNEIKLIVKRILDLTFTLISMPLILPGFGLIALAIKHESPGPVFFIQDRVGLKKRIFPMYKFRSMHIGADEELKSLEDLNEAEGPIFKITNDPRVTKVGRFLRRTSLDELPQLFNVIRGEMSLVGPRPMSTRDVDLFDRGIQRKRFSVKPGLTCSWQISGRSNLPFTKWLELDLDYIENWSLLLDLKILFKTLPAVIKGHGAV